MSTCRCIPVFQTARQAPSASQLDARRSSARVLRLTACPVGRHFHVPLLDIERHLPVKALFPFAGFWREHQGPHAPPDASPALLRFTYSCWSTDVLVHGSHNFPGAPL